MNEEVNNESTATDENNSETKETTYICEFCSSHFKTKEDFLLHFTESACKIQSIGRIESKPSGQIGTELTLNGASDTTDGINQNTPTSAAQILCTVDMILCEQGNKIFIAPDTLRVGEQADNLQQISFICQMADDGQSAKSASTAQQIIISEETNEEAGATQQVEVLETVDANGISEDGMDVQLVVQEQNEARGCESNGIGETTENNASEGNSDESPSLEGLEYEFKCHICDKRLKTKAGLERHKIFHAKDKTKSFLCDTCGKHFTTPNRLLKHEEIHERTREEDHRRKHELQEIDENTEETSETFICETCQKTFSHSCCLLEHERVHFKENLKKGKDKFPCSLCEKSFHAASHLARHEKSHDRKNTFVCNECGESFPRKNSLLKHEAIHSNVKPFVCNICSRGFMQSSNLTTHLRIHTKSKPYPCNTCGKTFSHSSSRVIHERTHTGEKPYICETCGKKFRQSGDLAKHRRSHTGEKPYHCAVCGKTFSVQSNLLAHLRIHVKKNSQNAASLALVISEAETGRITEGSLLDS